MGIATTSEGMVDGDSSTSNVSWDPSVSKVRAPGYCFDCDEAVPVEYYEVWAGTQPPRTCLHCGGHDVEFLGRVAGRLLERIEGLEQRLERDKPCLIH